MRFHAPEGLLLQNRLRGVVFNVCRVGGQRSLWITNLAKFFLKPVFWNTDGYLRPSGFPANSGYPKDHGYGHEEWNNSPRLSYTRSGTAYRAFHTEGIGDVPAASDGPIVLFMYASHDRVQQLVGVAAQARCLNGEEDERIALVDRLNLRDLWRDAWRLPSVKAAYSHDRAAFLTSWKADFFWFPTWTCPAGMFFQPSQPITLNPVRIRGTTKLLTMFGRHTLIDAQTSMRVLTSVPSTLRSVEWHNVAEVVARAGGSANNPSDDLEDIQSTPGLNNTTRQALIAARVGQGQFRKQVAQRWGGSCAVNGCAQQEVLRASHVKPWWASTNKERLDPANGIFLTANLDALFDRGLLTFDDEGKMLVSQSVPSVDRSLLGVPRRLRRSPRTDERVFLEYHRDQVFRA